MTKNKIVLRWTCAVFVHMLFAARVSHADLFIEERGAFESATTTTKSFKIEIPDGQREYGISITAVLDAGSGSLRVLDPSGEMVYQHLWGTRESSERARLPVAKPGVYTMQVDVENARGEWRARIVALPPRAGLRWMYLSAGLLVGLPLFATLVMRLLGARVQYAAAGILMLFISKAFFGVGAFFLYRFAFVALEDAMPYKGFLWVQSVVLGAWEGVTALFGTLLVMRFMKSIHATSAHAVAAGIGRGAVEMLLTGVASFLGLVVMFGNGPKSDKAQFLQAYDMAVTPLLPVADPVIYVARAICAIAATTLIAFGVRTRRAAPVFGGAVIFGAALGAVSAARVISLFGAETRWLLPAVLMPLTVVAFAVLRRNLAEWVESPKSGETALDAFLRQYGGEDG